MGTYSNQLQARLRHHVTGAIERGEAEAIVEQHVRSGENGMVRGRKYNWRNQPERLIYIGKRGSWHQFKKIGDPRAVWCEVLTEDLQHFEVTT